MDRRPSDGPEVDDEDLDGPRQKSSNGPEAMLGIGRPWKLGTRRGDWAKTTGYVAHIQARHGEEEDQAVIVVVRLYLFGLAPSGIFRVGVLM
ncbi:hypothetical protein U9M48_023607 [Paspalum notatum var. saurae]|uniref:Uncharacterized protein n=1 Tax=Paspalum notatum var. saurae TaxID=547442 RepID=A0AAQ3WUV9_PASNO